MSGRALRGRRAPSIEPFDGAFRRATVRRHRGMSARGDRQSVTQHSRDTPQFYLTAPSPCPYLPGKEERKVFTHLVGERAGELNDLLTHGGFRRSQSIAYRPACEACRACVSVRVVAEDFRPTRSMRRIAERNADIIGEMRPAGADLRAIFGVPRLSRRAPPRRRHGRHDRARLRDDGRGQPCRDAPRRVSPARPRQRLQRARQRPAARGRAHRRAQ